MVIELHGACVIDSLYFLRRFLRHPRLVASVVPSSRTLARALIAGIDLHHGDLVIEYGPGTGPITREIARAIEAGRRIRYLGIERDAGLCRHLTQRFPDLEFVCDDVLNVGSICAERGLGPAKAIISAVPLILMSEPEVRQVLTASRSCLQDHGTFRTISFVHSYPRLGARRLRSEMAAAFRNFGVERVVWWNVPPALVLGGVRQNVTQQ